MDKLKDITEEIPKIEKTYAVGPESILEHILGTKDIITNNKNKKLIIYQQDLLLAISSTEADDWNHKTGIRLIQLFTNTLLFPSKLEPIFGGDCVELRKKVIP